MRFARGVVKIPVKVLYVILIVLSTSFFLYLHILKYQRVEGYDHCRLVSKYKLPSGGTHGRPQQNSSVCLADPRKTKIEDCPMCYRPNVKNISEKLTQIRYNVSMFPRGPAGLFTLKSVVQQDHIQDYLITPRSVCVDTCPYLIAVLLSISDDTEQRDAIRSSWGSVAKTRLWPNAEINADFQLLFVLAHKTPDSYIRYNEQQAPKKYMESEFFPTMKEWAVIKREADIYGDILYLNMQDSYYNLTLKLMSAFKWVGDHCPKAKFVLKVDVDTFVNVPLLLDVLIVNEERLGFSLMGKMYVDQRIVLRETKWAVDSEMYPPPIFPVYASGCAYVMSLVAMSALVEVFPFYPAFPIEDALITGVLARIINIEHWQGLSSLFTDNMDFFWDRCDFVLSQKIAGTGVSFPFKLRNMWASIVYDDGLCAENSLITMSCYCSKKELY